ncbi:MULTISPECIES: winged helix-turn-helix domain-containing protein [unclassified Micromonospora]|uniref:AfsR/SARP family transcriptional regulator n=1 Tax=unclassified Micromonospora TaxID=2617518 RepID=UPI0033AA42F2
MGLSFEILGPVRIRRDGQPVRTPAGRPTALLVTLLLHAGTAVPVERLREELWGERAPASAVANLRSHASQLRHLLNSPDEPVRLPADHGGLLQAVQPEFGLQDVLRQLRVLLQRWREHDDRSLLRR